MKQIFKDIVHSLKSIAFLPRWWAQKYQKRDPYLWTFDAWQGQRYSDNPRALYEYVLENVPQIQCYWLTRSQLVYDRLKKANKPVALINSKEGIDIQKKSDVFFATHGNMNNISEGDIRYMNGIHYINLWHGAPLKMIGDDEWLFKQKNTPYKRFKTWCRKRIMPWEFLSGTMLCDSSFFLPFMQSAFGRSYKNMMVLPEPRLDKLFLPEKESFILSLNQRFNNPTKVLYMPTFRDMKFGVFNPFTQAGFAPKSFSAMLEEHNIVLLYKGHFLDSHADSIKGCERIITVSDTDYDDLYTFIKDVDVLITDYSSIYFDFICLRKPIILFPFDLKDYMAHSRPFYFDYNLMQARRVFSWKELAECLANKDYCPPTEEEIRLFRPIPAEHCCENIVHELQKELALSL